MRDGPVLIDDENCSQPFLLGSVVESEGWEQGRCHPWDLLTTRIEEPGIFHRRVPPGRNAVEQDLFPGSGRIVRERWPASAGSCCSPSPPRPRAVPEPAASPRAPPQTTASAPAASGGRRSPTARFRREQSALGQSQYSPRQAAGVLA